MKTLSMVIDENEAGMRKWREGKRDNAQEDIVYQNIDSLYKYLQTYPQLYYVKCWLEDYDEMFWERKHDKTVENILIIAQMDFNDNTKWIVKVVERLLPDESSWIGKEVEEALLYCLEGFESLHDNYVENVITDIDMRIEARYMKR